MSTVQTYLSFLQARVKSIAATVFGFSVIANLLMLVSPIFMLQIYDRVLTSGSLETLLVLSLIAIFLLVLMGLVDTLRHQMLSRAAREMTARIENHVFDQSVDSAGGHRDALGQPMRDLETVQNFASSRLPLSFFDAPFTPFFLMLIFWVHPVLGGLALVSLMISMALAFATDRLTKDVFQAAGGLSRQAQNYLDSSLRNQDSMKAMNIADGIRTQWARYRLPGQEQQAIAQERLQWLTGASRAFRMIVQTAILATGAALALDLSISPGAIIASSIILGRAFAPVEQSISGWRTFVRARAAFARLKPLLDAPMDKAEAVSLPRPTPEVRVDSLVATRPKLANPILKGIGFAISAGDVVAIMGPSGAGKSFLARHLVGADAPLRGQVTLGKIDVALWDRSDRAQHIGFLPQSVELFDGTIAQNICRFGEIDEDALRDAVDTAHCAELVHSFPDTYQTEIGGDGFHLSGGQAQRIALARAVYQAPAFLVLDEPDSNLDQNGEEALARTIKRMKDQGSTVVLITHNMRLLQIVDKILLLKAGEIVAYGQRDDILAEMTKKRQPAGQSSGASSSPAVAQSRVVTTKAETKGG